MDSEIGGPPLKEGRSAAGYRPKPASEISRNMAAIRSTETRTEVELRRILFSMGLRFRKNVSHLPGRPDIVFPRARVAVFIDGDYWHGRVLREAGLSAARARFTEVQRAYWIPKLQRNVARDDRVTRDLMSSGWTVLRMWESQVRLAPLDAAIRIADLVTSSLSAR